MLLKFGPWRTDPAWMENSGEIQAVSAQAGDATSSSELQRVAITKVEVLNDRLVPGSDGSIEHVVIANNAVTIIRSAELKGRVRISRSNVHIGGVSCKVLLAGLEARIDTVRHLVGGDSPVHGALFLTKQRSSPVKFYKSMAIGSPKAVVQYLIEEHCARPTNPKIGPLTKELDAIFLPLEKLSAPAA